MDAMQHYIDFLIDLKKDNYMPLEMLEKLSAEIKQNKSNVPSINFICFCAFRVAFDLSIKQAMPIMGWIGFKDYVSYACVPDEEINGEVYSLIYRVS